MAVPARSGASARDDQAPETEPAVVIPFPAPLPPPSPLLARLLWGPLRRHRGQDRPAPLRERPRHLS